MSDKKTSANKRRKELRKKIKTRIKLFGMEDTIVKSIIPDLKCQIQGL